MNTAINTDQSKVVAIHTKNQLALKMARIMLDMGSIEQTGRNDFQKYDYTTESDILKVLRPLMAKYGIVLFPTVVDHESRSQGKNSLTTITMDFTLIDGDSGQSHTTRWIGQGVDSGDKSYYKAYTGATKYFLMKTFLVSTGDDPEQDSHEIDHSRQANPENQIKDIVGEIVHLVTEYTDRETAVKFTQVLARNLKVERLSRCQAWELTPTLNLLKNQPDKDQAAAFIDHFIEKNR